MTVELQHLRREFGGVVALDDVSLSVPRGEFLALLGPSGSGKTTLLRVLAGLDFASTGRILVGGRDMSGVPARLRRIGFVFQHYALFRHMTVAANIAFGLNVRPRATRPPAAAIRARVEELLELMGIPDLAKRMPNEISGGQRQRVALARALAIEPELLLLDEPFGALDAKVRHNLRIWLRKLHDRMGLTSVFVTHDQAEAMEMADRVALMRAGRIEQVDTPDRLYAEPASAFVHEFLGEAVRLPCVVDSGWANFDPLPLPPLPTTCEAGPAIALIRPHEIRLIKQPGPALVEAVHASGPLAHIRLRMAQIELEVTQPFGSALPRPGERWALDFGLARIYPANGGPAGRVIGQATSCDVPRPVVLNLRGGAQGTGQNGTDSESRVANNALTIGNVEDAGFRTVGELNSGSSRGPTGNNQMKPDLVTTGSRSHLGAGGDRMLWTHGNGREVQRGKQLADRALVQGHGELPLNPSPQINTPPAHHAIIRHGPAE